MQGSYEKTSNTVLDPVCGMYVTPEKAMGRVQHQGKDYYFCSKHCEQKFAGNPEQYLKAKPGNLVQLGGIAQVKSNSSQQAAAVPGTPSKPQSSASTSKTAKYICPMDPEV